MKTKMPSALVYGWYKEGSEILVSDVYWEEGLFEDVHIYSLPWRDNLLEDYSKYRPDIIVSFGKEIPVTNKQLQKIYKFVEDWVPDNVLANMVVCEGTFRACEIPQPRFSIFSPTYKTNERIFRTYESLKNQKLEDWEWVVVDDSPDEKTWKYLKEIAAKDFRVKPHRIYPLTGGNIGMAKHRAGMMCEGEWIVELDHDDCLTSECLQTCWDAHTKYPDAGFMYTNCCEMYDDGTWKTYDHDWSGNYYARPDNYFDFGYAGHTMEMVDGKELVAHNYPDINPLSIRFNISMPNHAKVWKREVYHDIFGHNERIPVADDLEINIKTFLHTRFIHVKKVLYLQYNNKNSTTDNNSSDINRRARLIRDHYDKKIHQRIAELGFFDWNWNEELGHSNKFQNGGQNARYFEEEQVMNYIYE
jgi:glycosyltransferase involved in cell wall biosynthesis